MPPADAWLAPWQQAAILAAFAFALFSPTLGAGLVYDARMQILTDGFIHDAGNWPDVLSCRVLGRDVLDFNRPVHLASLMLDAAVWGREPFGYHLTSILLHAANTVLVWLVLREASTQGTRVGGFATDRHGFPVDSLATFLAACLFAAHPVVAEAVCEPSYREDLLVAFWSLAGLWLAMRHDPAALNDTGADLWRALGCTVASLLAIASKETGIAAPMLLGAYWLLFRRGEPGRFWLVAIGAAKAVTLGFLAARFLLAPHPSRIFETPPQYPGGSFAQAMLLEPRILALYVQVILFPVNLCADYGAASLAHLPLPAALALLSAVAGAAAIGARRDRRVLLAGAIVFLPLIPVANLIPIYRAAADRYLYLPLAGVSLAASCLLSHAVREPLRRRVFLGGLVAVALLAMACVERQRVWAGSLALWADAHAKNPASCTAATGYGEALRDAGRLTEAERALRTAIRICGDRGDIWATLALVLDAQGRTREADDALAKALDLDPRLATPEALVQRLAMERPMAADLEKLLAGRERSR
jgi:tetratricopeptide (TPR) repeat protein